MRAYRQMASRVSPRNFSNSKVVSQLRYIQSVHETTEFSNPDTFGRHFVPVVRRWRLARLPQKQLAKLRFDPFYRYLLARTKYYDGVLLDAISGNMQYIISVGCGNDTRPYRFQHVLKQKGVKVLECDQPEAISYRQRMANRLGTFDHIAYLGIELNDGTWPDFEYWLDTNNTAKALVLIEGVTPYVNAEAFGRFLSLLGRKLLAGSRVAYDFKFRGAADDFGRVGRTQTPFRLTRVIEELVAYHEGLGYRLSHVEQSSDLSARLLSDLADSNAPLFTEDGLIVLEVCR
jgi:methyltransferase (TIGR00027 family)